MIVYAGGDGVYGYIASTLRTFPVVFPATPGELAVPVETNLILCALVDVGQPLTHDVSVVPGEVERLEYETTTEKIGEVELVNCDVQREVANIDAA